MPVVAAPETFHCMSKLSLATAVVRAALSAQTPVPNCASGSSVATGHRMLPLPASTKSP